MLPVVLFALRTLYVQTVAGRPQLALHVTILVHLSKNLICSETTQPSSLFAPSAEQSVFCRLQTCKLSDRFRVLQNFQSADHHASSSKCNQACKAGCTQSEFPAVSRLPELWLKKDVSHVNPPRDLWTTWGYVWR